MEFDKKKKACYLVLCRYVLSLIAFRFWTELYTMLNVNNRLKLIFVQEDRKGLHRQTLHSSTAINCIIYP